MMIHFVGLARLREAGLRGMTGRAFGDLLAELDMYSLIRSRVLSRGRYGRTREITIDLSGELVEKIYAAIRTNFDLRT
jgi:cell division control protein 6